MLDFDTSKLLVWGLIALVVIGPKDLPKVMRVAGYWLGKARAMSSQFRAGFDQMVREAELAEMEKKWAEENAKIMTAHPAVPQEIAPPAQEMPEIATESAINHTPPPA